MAFNPLNMNLYANVEGGLKKYHYSTDDLLSEVTTADDRLGLMVKNLTDATNLTLKHSNLNLHKL